MLFSGGECLVLVWFLLGAMSITREEVMRIDIDQSGDWGEKEKEIRSVLRSCPTYHLPWYLDRYQVHHSIE